MNKLKHYRKPSIRDLSTRQITSYVTMTAQEHDNLDEKA